MSIIPNTNPFDDSPFKVLSTAPLSRDAVLLSNQFAWEETPEAHVLRGQVPGLNRDEVKVHVEDGRVLQVSGMRDVEKVEQDQNSNNATTHRVLERSTCKFNKSFTLPANARQDQVRASLENGVLTVTVPKMTTEINQPMENSY